MFIIYINPQSLNCPTFVPPAKNHKSPQKTTAPTKTPRNNKNPQKTKKHINKTDYS